MYGTKILAHGATFVAPVGNVAASGGEGGRIDGILEGSGI
jgi:hypothetical protein